MLLVIQAISTFAMSAVIWFVQLIQYSSFQRVGTEAFPAFHAFHSTRITFIVAPLMIAEAVSSLALLWRPVPVIAPWEAWLGVGLVALIWASTVLLQVPMHRRLSAAFDEDAWRFLCRSNWVRTLAWSVRSALVSGWLHRALEEGVRLL